MRKVGQSRRKKEEHLGEGRAEQLRPSNQEELAQSEAWVLGPRWQFTFNFEVSASHCLDATFTGVMQRKQQAERSRSKQRRFYVVGDTSSGHRTAELSHAWMWVWVWEPRVTLVFLGAAGAICQGRKNVKRDWGAGRSVLPHVMCL